MKTLSRLWALVLVCAFVGTASANILDTDPVVRADTETNWEQYSRILTDGIRSDNDGIRDAAMRLALQYADSVDISGATIDLMRIYRDSNDVQLRKMAAITLASIGTNLVEGYLRNCEEFEKDESVKHTLHVLNI